MFNAPVLTVAVGAWAEDGGRIVGAIFFSRLTYPDHPEVYILAAVAVHSDFQRQGIGRALIARGLAAMKQQGAVFAATYGDPAFYGKLGFRRLGPDVIAAPCPLSQPEGWLGQSLTGEPVEKIPGSCSCVQALDNPAYW